MGAASDYASQGTSSSVPLRVVEPVVDDERPEPPPARLLPAVKCMKRVKELLGHYCQQPISTEEVYPTILCLI